MSNASKGSRMERIALQQDLKEGWKLMPGGRAVRTRFQNNDVFSIADYVVWKDGKRKYVQVCDANHWKPHFAKLQAWLKYRLGNEEIELAVYKKRKGRYGWKRVVL